MVSARCTSRSLLNHCKQINKPKYIAFVLFDEPRRNTKEFLENFGGNTAAPTFSRIVRKVSPILNKNNYLKSY